MVKVIIYPNSQLDCFEKNEIYINEIFEITYLTMTKVIPSNNTKEADYNMWRNSFKERMNNGTKYILLYTDRILKGYLSYEIRDYDNDIFIGDVIIHPNYQGDGRTFPRLLFYFFKETQDCESNTITTHANNLNKRSQSIIENAGFRVKEEKSKGRIYCIDRGSLLNRYSKIIAYYDRKNKKELQYKK